MSEFTASTKITAIEHELGVGRFPTSSDGVWQLLSIECNLDLLLTAIIEARANPPDDSNWRRRRRDDFEAWAAHTPPDVPERIENLRANTHEETLRRGLLGRFPIACALELGVYALCQQLRALTKYHDTAVEFTWKIAALDPENKKQRLAILGAAFDALRRQNEEDSTVGPKARRS